MLFLGDWLRIAYSNIKWIRCLPYKGQNKRGVFKDIFSKYLGSSFKYVEFSNEFIFNLMANATTVFIFMIDTVNICSKPSGRYSSSSQV